MYERMSDKKKPPEIEDISTFIGAESYIRLQELEQYLQNRYLIRRELRFPFGKSYGWGFKYSHKTKHLFYIFFENGAITATIQIGDNKADKIAEKYPFMSEKAKLLWDNRYPCGQTGGWIHFRLCTDDDLNDVLKFIEIREKPVKKSK